MAVVKIKIKSGVIINGKEANPGEVWEVPKYLAQQFVGNGLAEPFVAEGEAPQEENYGVRVETPDKADPAPRIVTPPASTENPKDKTKAESSKVPSSPARP